MGVHDDWRKELTHAVREFAAEAVTDNDTLRSVLVTTMLGAIGDALAIDCCALFELADRDDIAGYHWCRPGMPSKEHPFEPRAFQALIRHATARNQPMFLTRSAEERPDGTPVEEVRKYLEEAMVQTAAVIPTGLAGQPGCVWMLGSTNVNYVWPEAVIEHL